LGFVCLGLGVGVLGFAPNPQTPNPKNPNPQSPIPKNYIFFLKNRYTELLIIKKIIKLKILILYIKLLFLRVNYF